MSNSPIRRGFVDPDLLNMIDNYLTENRDKPYIDIDDMSEVIRDRSFRFSRMKKVTFNSMIKDAYFAYCQQQAAKQQFDNPEQKNEVLESIDSDSDVEEIVDNQPVSKTMSNQLANLYSTPPQPQPQPSRIAEQKRKSESSSTSNTSISIINEVQTQVLTEPLHKSESTISISTVSLSAENTESTPTKTPQNDNKMDTSDTNNLQNLNEKEKEKENNDNDSDNDLEIIDFVHHSNSNTTTTTDVNVNINSMANTNVNSKNHNLNNRSMSACALPTTTNSFNTTPAEQNIQNTPRNSSRRAIEKRKESIYDGIITPSNSTKATVSPTKVSNIINDNINQNQNQSKDKEAFPGLVLASKRKELQINLDIKSPGKGLKRSINDTTTPGEDSSNSSYKNQEKRLKQQAEVGEEFIKPTFSPVTFADFGGGENIIEEICKLLMHLKHPEIYESLGVSPPRGFLLQGPPGCGKSLLANAIAGELNLPMLKIVATELISGISGESEKNIRNMFEQALVLAPCIIFIDEIDSITPKRETAQREMERRIVAQLIACIDELGDKEKGSQVLLIGATNRLESIDTSLRRAGRFDRELCLGIPDVQTREKILRIICRNLRLAQDFDFGHLSKLTPGYVGADLHSLIREAVLQAVNKIINSKIPNISGSEGSDLKVQETVVEVVKKEVNKEVDEVMEVVVEENENDNENENKSNINIQLLKREKSGPISGFGIKWIDGEISPLTQEELDGLFIKMEDFEKALKNIQPSAKREGFATVPDITWEDIGALQSIRDELQVSILGPVKHSESFQALGLFAPAGVLLCGPPGCGKTLLAKAVANEAGINFISVKGPELLNMYVGESERAVRQCFSRAKNSAPCVIFFDELDALCPKRHDGHESGASRVVNQLLTEMDGIESRLGVFIMAATNRPDIIDPAILRPGRLDKILFVDLPTAKDRLDILNTLTRVLPRFGPDVLLSEIATDPRCENYTGADLAALVRESSISAFREFILDRKPAGTVTGDTGTVCPTGELKVYKRHFEIGFQKTKPSVSKQDQEKYKQMRIKYSTYSSNE